MSTENIPVEPTEQSLVDFSAELFGQKKAEPESTNSEVVEEVAEEGDADEWDPDFEEFDVPKSRKGGKKEGEEEEDFKFEEDEEFKDLDLFNDGGFDDEEEDF